MAPASQETTAFRLAEKYYKSRQPAQCSSEEGSAERRRRNLRRLRREAANGNSKPTLRNRGVLNLSAEPTEHEDEVAQAGWEVDAHPTGGRCVRRLHLLGTDRKGKGKACEAYLIADGEGLSGL
jgi:hypothetical protein